MRRLRCLRDWQRIGDEKHRLLVLQLEALAALGFSPAASVPGTVRSMTTVYLSIRVATSDVKKAMDAAQRVGFQVRIIEEFPPEPLKTDLELSIQYLSDDPHDVEPQHHAGHLRDDGLQESGVPWEHLSSGIGAGPTLSTFTIRPKGQPDHPGQKVVAANWDQFNVMCDRTYGFAPSQSEYDIHIEGLAAHDDPRG